MTAHHLRHRLQRDPGGGREDGSIVIALLMVMVISIGILTMTTGAIQVSHLSLAMSTNNNNLQAATAGGQAAVAQIRAATNSAGYVVPSALPCSAITGLTNGAGTVSYSSTITYFVQTPSGSYQPEACSTGLGPAVTSTAGSLSKAVITSCAPAGACPTTGTPTGASQWRRVVSTYAFNTTNANIPGGEIMTDDGKACMVAVITDGVNPANGMTLATTATCAPGNQYINLEQFQYTTGFNLAIQINGTQWCIQDPEDVAGTIAINPPVTFGLCTSGYLDQWGITDTAGIEGVLTNGSGDPNLWCLENVPGSLDVSIPSATPVPATVVACAAAPLFQTWILAASVGAGGAAPTGNSLFGPTSQLVNFDEFGRCLDVTNQSVTSSYLIDYPCKQFPDTASFPTWNQRWCFNPTSAAGVSPPNGSLYTVFQSTSCGSAATTPLLAAYCLTSPLSPGGAYVTVRPCSPFANPAPSGSQLWTAWGSTTTNVLHSYTWQDSAGYCLETNPAIQQNPAGAGSFSTIAVDTCNGSLLQQKWNAPPTQGLSQVSNVHEQTGLGAYTPSP